MNQRVTGKSRDIHTAMAQVACLPKPFIILLYWFYG